MDWYTFIPADFFREEQELKSIKIRGRKKVHLTNFRIIVKNSNGKKPTKTLLTVPLLVISRCDILETFFLIITTKFGPVIKLNFEKCDDAITWCSLIQAQINSQTELSDRTFAFIFKKEINLTNTYFQKLPHDVLSDIFRLHSHPDYIEDLELLIFRHESQRLRMLDSKWTEFENTNYEICSSYPRHHFIPNPNDYEFSIKNLASYRSHNRFPSVVWRSSHTEAVLVRTAQPTTGIFGTRNEEDENLVKAIAKCCCRNECQSHPQLLIIDARSNKYAMFNRLRGGGTETIENYKGCELQYMDLVNMHAVQTAFDSLTGLLSAKPDRNWFATLENTCWLQYLSQILSSACKIAKTLTVKGIPVMVHCTDGWDRTSQLCALSKLLVDPHYRTILGFIVLIEREWLQFGHKFADRCRNPGADTPQDDRSPVFLQWLDCVYQILVQFPEQFEFNEQFLIKIGTHVYSGQFGTFFCNNQAERKRKKIHERTCSLWSLLVNDKNWPLQNFSYQSCPSEEVIYPDTCYHSLRLWKNMYSKCLFLSKDDHFSDLDQTEINNDIISTVHTVTSDLETDEFHDENVSQKESENKIEHQEEYELSSSLTAPVEKCNFLFSNSEEEIGKFKGQTLTEIDQNNASTLLIVPVTSASPIEHCVQQIPHKPPFDSNSYSFWSSSHSAPVQSFVDEMIYERIPKSEPNEYEIDNGVFINEDEMEHHNPIHSVTSQNSSETEESFHEVSQESATDALTMPRDHSSSVAEEERYSFIDTTTYFGLPIQHQNSFKDSVQSELRKNISVELKESVFVFDCLPLNIQHATAFMHMKNSENVNKIKNMQMDIDKLNKKIRDYEISSGADIVVERHQPQISIDSDINNHMNGFVSNDSGSCHIRSQIDAKIRALADAQLDGDYLVESVKIENNSCFYTPRTPRYSSEGNPLCKSSSSNNSYEMVHFSEKTCGISCDFSDLKKCQTNDFCKFCSPTTAINRQHQLDIVKQPSKDSSGSQTGKNGQKSTMNLLRYDELAKA